MGPITGPSAGYCHTKAFCVHRQTIRLRIATPGKRIKQISHAGSGGGKGNYSGKRQVGASDGDGADSASTGWWWRLLFAATATCGVFYAANEREKSRFEAWQGPDGQAASSVSIVIPALNEEARIRDLISYLKALEPPADEIIVVDGGSTDRTVKEAEAAGARVLTSERSRARQMNRGGSAAGSDLLCFVHADSTPPRDLVRVMRYEMSDRTRVAGALLTRITHNGRLLWWMTFHHLAKTYYMPLLLRPFGFFRGLRCVFGDQTLFMRREDFVRSKGYREALPIMEDADLIIRLHERSCYLWPGKRGAVRHVMYRSQETSGRRMVAWGTLYTTWIHFLFGLTWYFTRDDSPERLQRMYERLYGDNIRT